MSLPNRIDCEMMINCIIDKCYNNNSPKIMIMPKIRKCFILRFENIIFILEKIIPKLNSITTVQVYGK